MIDITGLSKAAVFAALYNRAKVQDMVWLHARAWGDMTTEQAQQLLDNNTPESFDYVDGRAMRISFIDNTIPCSDFYNRYNGNNAAETVIANLRKEI